MSPNIPKYYIPNINQSVSESISLILYCSTAKSHIKLMGTHNHYPYPFLSQSNIFLSPSEVGIYKKPTHQYE